MLVNFSWGSFQALEMPHVNPKALCVVRNKGLRDKMSVSSQEPQKAWECTVRALEKHGAEQIVRRALSVQSPQPTAAGRAPGSFLSHHSLGHSGLFAPHDVTPLPSLWHSAHTWAFFAFLICEPRRLGEQCLQQMNCRVSPKSRW